jgi:hypothetical protein
MTSSIPLVTLAPQQNGGRANKDDGPVAALTRALCFDRYRDDRKQDGGSPYMVYIEQCTPLRGTKEDFLRLFADTVEFFKGMYDA